LLFVGSRPEHVDPEDWATVGKALGYASRELSFQLLVGSDSESSLDRQVMAGALQASKETGHPVDWQLYELDDARSGQRFTGTPWRGLPRPPPARYPPSEDGGGRWESAHLAALDHAHAVIALGGAKNTRRLCRFSEERGVLTLPLPIFGGEALKSFGRQGTPRGPETTPKLSQRWKDLLQGWTLENAFQRARDLLVAIRRFTRRIRRRLYFISYSRKDQARADHVELLLRRRDRGVLRDETRFQAGELLEREVERVLAGAHDVIVLTSDAARKSEWVNREVKICKELRARGGHPERLVPISLDGAEPGFGLNKVLYLPGKLRVERERAVARIVDQEP